MRIFLCSALVVLVSLPAQANTPTDIGIAPKAAVVLANPDAARVRLSRNPARTQNFRAPVPGYAMRWYARLKNPPLCQVPLCHGTCASLDISWSTERIDDRVDQLETPCSLPIRRDSHPDAGCCSD